MTCLKRRFLIKVSSFNDVDAAPEWKNDAAPAPTPFLAI
jgi:hypothetical protein